MEILAIFVYVLSAVTLCVLRPGHWQMGKMLGKINVDRLMGQFIIFGQNFFSAFLAPFVH